MSDDEEQFNAKSHRNLLQAIGSLGKTQHIRKTTRSEPKQQQDEFQLVKGVTTSVAAAAAATATPAASDDTGAAPAVGITDLVHILRSTKQHLDIGKQLRNVKNTKKVLERPLEKPAADRIKRTIGYENVKEKLARWDAVVAKNRSAETHIFPLKSETIYIDTFAHSKPLQPSLKSTMALEMEATEAKLRALKRARSGDTDDEKALEQREKALFEQKMTRDELRARRKEMAYLKLRESQKSAKARMQNKIKSKKYHKLMKRQKLKEQIKEFELLQKTDPEAAMSKLNELEKSRVLERASLRHKNTGSWAKNLQIRAKYDKDVRKDLAEQLQISRELTQKKDDSGDEADADADMEEMDVKRTMEVDDDDPFNPWMRAGKGGGVAQAQASGAEMENWRKYWMERNKNKKLLEEYQQGDAPTEQLPTAGGAGEVDATAADGAEEEVAAAAAAPSKKAAKKKADRAQQSNGKVKGQPAQKLPQVENGWLVEEIRPAIAKNIDDIFDAQEDKVRTALGKKLKVLSKEAKRLQKTSRTKVEKRRAAKDELKNLKDLSFKSDAKRPVIDEELNHDELLDGEPAAKRSDLLESTAAPVKGNNSARTDTAAAATAATTLAENNIDPNKLPVVRLQQHKLNTMDALDDAAVGEADYDEVADDALTQQQMTISQAFEDDDIIADFSRDKTKESELKNTAIQLTMPGWGSWAGAGISAERQAARNKRLVIKTPDGEKRRDENKHGVFINEEAGKQLRAHLVSDVPFPFTSLQDYEASIRAPIGRTFVPETAFRMLTRPAVITRKGQVIEPMDDSELVKAPRPLRNVVDKRIERAAKAN